MSWGNEFIKHNLLGWVHYPAHLVSPGNQPSPLLRQVVLVRPNAQTAQIQLVTFPARLNGCAGVHFSPAVVLHGINLSPQIQTRTTLPSIPEITSTRASTHSCSSGTCEMIPTSLPLCCKPFKVCIA